MKCIYCDLRCKRQRNPDTDKAYENKWICLNHGNWLCFNIDHDNILLWTYYTVQIDSFLYGMTIDHESNRFNISMYDEDNPKLPTKIVLRLNFIPDITPLNFKEKLPIILTFL